MISQRQIRDLIFETIEDAINNGRPNEVCYVVETGAWYKTRWTDIEPDNYVTLETSYDKNLKWIKIKEPFEAWRDPVKSYAYNSPATIPEEDLIAGARFIVKPTGIDEWEGHDNEIAILENGTWRFVKPAPGDIVLTLDTWAIYKYIEDPDNPGSYIWFNILSDIKNVIDVSYATLVDYINNAQLKPGVYYRLIDYYTNNWVNSGHTERYISENEELLLLALTTDTIASSAYSQKYPKDKISYSIESKVLVQGTVRQNSSFEGWGPTSPNIYRYTYDGYQDRVEVTANFIDNSTLEFPNIDVSIARIKVGNDGVWRKLDGTEGVVYDGTNIVLTDSNLTFYVNAGFIQYRIAEFKTILVDDDEYPHGKIYFREDTESNTKADFDFRNFKFKRFLGKPTRGAYATDDYYMVSSSDELRWTDYNGDQQGYTSSETSSLIEPITSCSNLEIYNSRYCVCKNIQAGIIKYTVDSTIFTGNDIEIYNSYYIIFNAASDVKRTKITNSRHIFTTTYYFNGLVIVPVELNDVDIRVDRELLFNNGITNTVITGFGRVFFEEGVGSEFSELELNNVKFEYSKNIGFSYSKCSLTNVNFSKNNFTIRNSTFVANVNSLEVHDDITNSHVSIDSSLNSFLDGKIENSNLKISLNESTLLSVYNSDIKGNLNGFSFDRDISDNSITINSDYTIPAFPLYILSDVSSNPIIIELPPNPYQGLEINVVDIAGNAGTNNITINVSQNPDTGVVNTINGGTSKIINLDYGFLKLIYDSTAGWIVGTESTLQLDGDNVTIEVINDLITIKNINYIIDDDNESIDGSNTEASDPHTELVTRAYVDNNVNVNADNGLTKNTNTIPSTIELGGTLTKNTVIDNANNYSIQFHHPTDTQPNADFALTPGVLAFQYIDPNDADNSVVGYITKDYINFNVGKNSSFNLGQEENLYSISRITNKSEVPHIGYVDSRSGVIRVKAISFTNQDLNAQGNNVIDGYTVQDQELVAFVGQTTTNEDGIYRYDANTGTFSRAIEFPIDYDISGYSILVENGTQYANTLWHVKSPAVLGTDDIQVVAVNQGIIGNYTFTNGLTENNDIVKLGGALIEDTTIDLSGNTLSIGETNANWIYDSQNSTINSSYQTLKVKNDNYGLVQINLENANATDNYTGASIVVTSSNTDYQDNTYISHLGVNFYVPDYQNSGLVYSDRKLWIGNPYDPNSEVNLVLGDDFGNPNIKLQLANNSVIVKNDTSLYYEKAKTPNYAYVKDINVANTQRLAIDKTNGLLFSNDGYIPEKTTRVIEGQALSYAVEAVSAFELKTYFRKDPNLIRVYLNDTELVYGTDWDLSLPYPDMPLTSPLQLDYTTKIKYLGDIATLTTTDVLRVEIDEYTIPYEFHLRLIHWWNGAIQAKRDKMVTKSIDVAGTKYYLDSVTFSNGRFKVECTYKDTNVFSTNTHTVTKTFNNTFYITDRNIKATLPYKIEIWRETRGTSYNSKTNTYLRPTYQYGGHLVPAYMTDTNLVEFGNTGTLRYQTVYHVRLRFEDQNGTAYYTPFYYKISKRKFDVFTTDATFTNDNYEGVYYNLKIMS